MSRTSDRPPLPPPSPPPRAPEESAWDEPPDPQLLAPGKTLAEQLLRGSRFLALYGSLNGSPGQASERWPWHYMEASAELMDEMVRASGPPRRGVLALLGNAPFDSRPTKWPRGLVEYLVEEDPRRIQTLATGAPGILRPQSAQDRLRYNPRLCERYGYGLIISPLMAGQPHTEAVPWERAPKEPAPDLQALIACLEQLEAHQLGSPAPARKPVPLAACACHRPELLQGRGKWTRDGVRYSALAVSEGTLAEAAEAAQRQELLDRVGELWKRVREGKDVQELLSQSGQSDFVQRFLAKRNKALLGSALRLAQAVREASPPHEKVWTEKWGPVCTKFLDLLRAAGRKGVTIDHLKSELEQTDPSKILENMKDSRIKKKAELAEEIEKLRNHHNDGRYYLYPLDSKQSPPRSPPA